MKFLLGGHTQVFVFKKLWIILESISSTFCMCIFHTKVNWAAFLSLEFGFEQTFAWKMHTQNVDEINSRMIHNFLKTKTCFRQKFFQSQTLSWGKLRKAEKSCSIHFWMKNACVKWWWNWRLVFNNPVLIDLHLFLKSSMRYF